jgi:hypothetical protein
LEIVKRNEAVKIAPMATYEVLEYDTANRDISTCVIKIHGRVPEKGNVRNNVCTSVRYILEGKGSINGKAVEAGDVLLIEKGEEYYLEGDFTFVESSSPAWFREQFEILE